MRVHQETNGLFHVVLANGNFARDTNCEVWSTADGAKASEALAYLAAGKPRHGAHWLKSTFGTEI